ncbi:MAG TPA: oligosaccharide flippase family protein, partial [Sphingobacteriaceae bacterium]|nr:oligosaccharide flippase family protein [Sphingobacteriaceae bacterium]
MKAFIKSFFSFGLATSVQKIISFLLLPIYTRVFTKEEFAVIDLMQVVLAVMSIFAVLQLETALQRFYYEFEGKKRKILISSIFTVIILLSCFLTCLLLAFSHGISAILFETSEYSTLVQLASLQMPFANMSMLGFVILRYEKRNVTFVLLIFLKVFTSLGFILLFVLWLDMGLFGILYAQLIALSVSTIVLMIAMKDNYVLNFSRDYLKESLKYSLPQFPARIGSILLSYGNRFFMVGYLSLASIGIYSLSLKMASVIQLIYSAFIMAWGPFIFEQQQKNANHKEV